MKQDELIKDLNRTAQQLGKRLDIRSSRKGFHLTTDAGALHLGPDTRSEIHRRHVGRYYKSLGLPPAA